MNKSEKDVEGGRKNDRKEGREKKGTKDRKNE